MFSINEHTDPQNIPNSCSSSYTRLGLHSSRNPSQSLIRISSNPSNSSDTPMLCRSLHSSRCVKLSHDSSALRLDRTSVTPFCNDVIWWYPTTLISFYPRSTAHTVAALITLLDRNRPLIPQANAVALSPTVTTADVSHPFNTGTRIPTSHPMYSAKF